MSTVISHEGVNHGIELGVMNGDIGSITIGQTALLDQECLRALRTTDPHHDKERIKDSKGGLLEDCYRWILDNQAFKQWQNSQSNRVLWIRGDPGKGKTMLLCGIIEELEHLYGDSATISFFFCQATDIRINSATSVLRGLIYLLVEKNPSLLSHLRPHYEKAGKALFEDVNAWSALTTIFTSILKDSSLKPHYLVIDALDECMSGLESLLKLIVLKSAEYPEVKWVVSSRNHPKIIKRLDSATQIAPILLELNEASVSEAVKLFIHQKVNTFADTDEYDPETRENVRQHLLLKSQGTFLWVALVCKELEEAEWWHAQEIFQTFPTGLSALYRRMINQIHETRDAKICKEILSIVSLVYRPITLSELGTFIERRINHSINPVMLRRIIGFCGSFLILRDQTVTFVHQSAKDFLTREVFTEISPAGLDSEHHTIFSQCLDVLFKTLRRDIFDLKLQGVSTKDISAPSPNPLVPAEYACVYWVDHLYACKTSVTYRLSLKNRERVDTFLKRKYLNWLEALSILGKLSDGIHAMKRLASLIAEESMSDGLLERAQDASSFVQYYRTGIESRPLQVYCSPLVFSPSKSLTIIAFQEDRPRWVLNYPIVKENWSACLQNLKGHSDLVNWITWSPDGSQLASGSSDKTVRIWDPATGQSVSTLEGHSNWVRPIAWSLDGSRLALGSYDDTVRIWDPATGQIVSTLSTCLTSFVQFDVVDSNFLPTNAGIFSISSVDAVTPMLNSFTHPPKQCGYGISGDSTWVTFNGLNLLWLPPDYRPLDISSFAVHEAKMAIVCSSYRVFFLVLSEQCPIPSL